MCKSLTKTSESLLWGRNCLWWRSFHRGRGIKTNVYSIVKMPVGRIETMEMYDGDKLVQSLQQRHQDRLIASIDCRLSSASTSTWKMDSGRRGNEMSNKQLNTRGPNQRPDGQQLFPRYLNKDDMPTLIEKVRLQPRLNFLKSASRHNSDLTRRRVGYSKHISDVAI